MRQRTRIGRPFLFYTFTGTVGLDAATDCGKGLPVDTHNLCSKCARLVQQHKPVLPFSIQSDVT